ncbi:hypothetical protein RHGRI_010072 [Rhododendron griersonianum]|uniref:SPARK domain-containing protein n=1 Tax=Rhododendron griersonianum TaxID=479676 RepID=A0AAV6KH45_9ERIC|nr:hypothetical protein RHGRI_010072 [Rhododendron griersonianum]
MKKLAISVLVFIFSLPLFDHSLADLLAEPAQPLNPGNYSAPTTTLPSTPIQTEPQTCRLDISDELFGGVSAACGRDLDRSRCCPVLAAWLFAAHARSALQLPAAVPASDSAELPTMPDDSQKCVNSLQSSLLSRNIRIPQPNASCDAVLCFCGIRLHQITSLSCPAAFNVTAYRNATPTAAVRNLEGSCRNSSYAGCTKCLGALEKLKGESKAGSKQSDQTSKMLSRDCQLMGLTWLLARNKTAYIPTVSAVLRAVMYSAHPPPQQEEPKCSPDHDNMPLAVDSLLFEKASASSSPSLRLTTGAFWFPILPLVMLVGLILLSV